MFISALHLISVMIHLFGVAATPRDLQCMSEAASITDIRRRKDGLVRNAKAYKMPKKILGTDLCHLIEHGNYQNICTHINIYIYIY